MRAVIAAPVDHGSQSRSLLHHGAGKALAEGGGGQIHLAHRLRVPDDAGRFTRQVEPGPAPEAEQLHIFAEPVHPELLPDLHDGVVAGIPDHITERLFSVSLGIGALDPYAGHNFVTVAEK